MTISNLFNGKNINTVAYDCNASDFRLVKTNIGWRLISNSEGIDDITGLYGVFRPSTVIEFDVSGNSGKVYRIYQAAFDREPDEGGLKFWINAMNNYNVSLQEVAAGFIYSNEFNLRYGTHPSNEQFVINLYANVLHRLPDENGYKYWLNLINSGKINNIDTLVNFSESPENKANVINKIIDAIDH